MGASGGLPAALAARLSGWVPAMTALRAADFSLRAVRLGTRGSALALAQADLVIGRCAGTGAPRPVDRVVVNTVGDVDKTSPLTVIGGRGVFTSALQDALVADRIDGAVHSAKDLPSEQHTALTFAAFLAREDPRDVLVSRHGLPLAALPADPVVGTSSRRRAAQVRALRPDARIVELRGNIDTRLRKALETDLDAIVLAAAGVGRMGWDHLVTERLPLEHFVPSPGQAALAVEIRAGDAATLAVLGPLDEPDVATAVRAERAFLRAIGGGCTTPVGAHARLDGGHVSLRAMLASEDGARVEWVDGRFAAGEAEAGAAALARHLVRTVEPDHARRSRRPGGVPAQGTGARALGGAGVRPPLHEAPASPLAGRTVLVTRAAEQASGLAAALAAAGAVPVVAPAIQILPAADRGPLDGALHDLAAGRYAWVAFTSANAVSRVVERVGAGQGGPGVIGGARVAAVGGATAEALARAGWAVDLVSATTTAEGLAAALARRGVDGQRVLLPQGNLARDGLAEGLRAAGATVDAVEVYRTAPPEHLPPDARDVILRGAVEAVTFASPSAVRNLAALLGSPPATRPGTGGVAAGIAALADAVVVCVGPTTAEAARAAGLDVTVVADDPSDAGLVAALVAYYSGRPGDSARGGDATPRDGGDAGVIGASDLDDDETGVGAGA